MSLFTLSDGLVCVLVFTWVYSRQAVVVECSLVLCENKKTFPFPLLNRHEHVINVRENLSAA